MYELEEQWDEEDRHKESGACASRCNIEENHGAGAEKFNVEEALGGGYEDGEDLLEAEEKEGYDAGDECADCATGIPGPGCASEC